MESEMPTQPAALQPAGAARGVSTGVLAETRPAPAPPVAAAAARSPRRSVWPVVALRVLAVAALCLLSVGMWDVVAGPYATSLAANAQARRDIASARSAAHSASSQRANDALAALAAARQRLRRDLADLPLDGPGRALVQSALDGDLTQAVRDVLLRYNQQNAIVMLPSSAIGTFSISCGSATLGTGAQALVAGAAASGQAAAPIPLYAVSDAGALYQVTLDSTSATATCPGGPIVSQGVKAVAGDQGQVYALTDVGGTWQLLQVGADGKTTPKIALPDAASTTVVALAVHGGDYYVAFQGANPAQSGILHFTGADAKKPAQSIQTQAGIVALSVAASGTPFALLDNGSVVHLDAAGQVAADPVSLATPIAAADPSAYIASTPVPTVPTAIPTARPTATPAQAPVGGAIAPSGTATPSPTAANAAAAASPGATPTPPPTPTPTPAPPAAPVETGSTTLFGGPSSISAAGAPAGDLFVGDGAAPRVVRFAVSGAELQPVRQYVYGAQLSTLQSVTASADGTRLFARSGDLLVQVALPG
jgi:hypothetical protein